MGTRSPTRYGRYEIVGPLASGGMADLFLARASGPSGFETLAVVKRIRPHLAANPDFVRLFLGEARLAAQLRHPNVVAVHDAGQERGEYYFVMEFVHGRDLRALIDGAAAKRRLLSFDEAISIAVGVCAGLHHAHEAVDADGRPLGIVHRDISPSNVLVSFDGAVKLADFGIAKATQLAKEAGTNTLRGKLTYMSPEQSLGAPLDRRSDLYSLAVVLYELTTGQRPFGRAASEFLEVKQTLETPPRPPSMHRRDYPLELEHIILRALERDRDKRYATAREMQLELEAFARRRQLAVSPLTLGHMMEQLFADELSAWQVAQRRGTSLAQHVTDTHSLEVAAQEEAARAAAAATLADDAEDGERTVVAAAAATRIVPTTDPAVQPRSRRVVVTTALLVAAGMIAFLVTAWPSRAPVDAHAIEPATAAAAATKPVATPTTTIPTTTAPTTMAATHAATAARATPPPAGELARAPVATRHAPLTGDDAPARARVRAHPQKHAAKKPRAAWDPEAPVLPH